MKVLVPLRMAQAVAIWPPLGTGGKGHRFAGCALHRRANGCGIYTLAVDLYILLGFFIRGFSLPPPLNPFRRRVFSTFYRYLFSTCIQTRVTVQKNGFIKTSFSGHAEYFLHYVCKKVDSDRGHVP